MTANPKPITRVQIAKILDETRDLKITLAKHTAERDEAVQAVVNNFTAPIAGTETAITINEAAIVRWAKENRKREFGEEKTITFDSGASIGFRLNPRKIVYVVGKDEEKVLASLRRRKLEQFISAKYSLNKTAVLAALGKTLKEAVAKAIGIKAEQEEEIQIKIPMATAGKEKA